MRRRGFLGAMLAVLAAPTMLARVAMDVAKGASIQRMRMRWTVGKEAYSAPWRAEAEETLMNSMTELISRDLEKIMLEGKGPVTIRAIKTRSEWRAR